MRLGRARGHEDLGVGVVGQAVEALLVGGDRGAQLGDARAGRVLVVPGPDGGDRGLGDDRRAVGVGEALAEVDRAGARGQRASSRRRSWCRSPAGDW